MFELVAALPRGELVVAQVRDVLAQLLADVGLGLVEIQADAAHALARLRSHLDEIERLLKKGGEIGKRLDFLIQELLREANTLGSKSPSIEMTAISVDMKVAIEQLREQVQNVE